jgi:hypothetical protein
MPIDEIIQLLSNEQNSLTEALLRTKVLLHQIQKKELTAWVNNELNGYPESAELPTYRILESRVIGDLMAPGWTASSRALPIMHLEADYRQMLERSEIRDSLALVQELATKPQGSIRRFFPPEAYDKLGSNLANGWKVQAAWCEIGALTVQNILIQVRSRLLDFILELKDSLGDATSEIEMKRKSSSLDTTTMFKNAIFGPNATIVVGDNNSQSIDNAIIQGNFNSLSKQLKQLGVDDAAIEELRRIDSDEKSKPDPDQPSLKQKVTNWIKAQVAKKLDADGQAAIAFSVDALTQAVRSYFDF